MQATLIKEESTGKYFAFLDEMKAVCAQGDTPEQCKDRLKENLNAYLKYMKTKSIVFQDVISYTPED